MKEPYQMDLFDLDDRAYQPRPFKINPFAISTMYKCPKCGEIVGHYIEREGWTTKRDECRNGHRLNWEPIEKRGLK